LRRIKLGTGGFEMKKLILCLLLAALFCINNSSVAFADNSPDMVTLETTLNLEETSFSQSNQNGLESFYDKQLEKNKLNDIKINLKLTKVMASKELNTQINYRGNGAFTIDNETFPFKVNGDLAVIETSSGTVIGGPLTGEIKTRKSDNTVANMYVVHLVNSNKIQITLTTGLAGDSENINFLAFGDYFPEVKDYADHYKQSIEKKDAVGEYSTENETQSVVAVTQNDYQNISYNGYTIGKLTHMGQLSSPYGNNIQIANMKSYSNNAAIAWSNANNIDPSSWDVSAHPDKVYLRITMPTEYNIPAGDYEPQSNVETFRIYFWTGGLNYITVDVPRLSISASRKSTANNYFYNEVSWTFSQYLGFGIGIDCDDEGLSGRVDAQYQGTDNSSYKVFGAGSGGRHCRTLPASSGYG
jgi:hypothetical protein